MLTAAEGGVPKGATLAARRRRAVARLPREEPQCSKEEPREEPTGQEGGGRGGGASHT
jgi:hypothetical protein